MEVFQKVYTSPTTFSFQFTMRLYLGTPHGKDHLGMSVSLHDTFLAAGGPDRVLDQIVSVVSFARFVFVAVA